MNSKVLENMYKLRSANFGIVDEKRKAKSEKLKNDRQERRVRNFNEKRNIKEDDLLYEECMENTKVLSNTNINTVVDRKLALKKYLAEKELLKKALKQQKKPPFKVGIPHHGASPVLKNIVNHSPSCCHKGLKIHNNPMGSKGTINVPRNTKTIKRSNKKVQLKRTKLILQAEQVSCKENITVIKQPSTTNTFDTLKNKKNKKEDLFEFGRPSPVEVRKRNITVEGATLQRARLDAETTRLLTLASEWETIGIQEELPQETVDEIDSVVGNTKLLTRDKFSQFRGLIDKFENPVGLGPTITSNDLDGFWEMMYIQVESLIQKYSDLKKLKENKWIKQQTNKKRRIKKNNSIITVPSSLINDTVQRTRKSQRLLELSTSSSMI